MATYTFKKKQFTDEDAEKLQAFADSNTNRTMEWDAFGQTWELESSKTHAEAELFAIENDMNLQEGDSSYPWDRYDFMKKFLHPDETVAKGKVTSITWNKDQTTNADGTYSYSGPVFKEDFTYTRNGSNFITQEVRVLTPYDEEAGAWGSNSKTYPAKKFTTIQAIEEGKQRRERLVDDLKAGILFLLMQQTNPSTSANYTKSEAEVAGGQFIVAYYTSMQMFITDAITTLITEATNDTGIAWLDYDIGGGTTIRDYITSALTINLGE